VESKRKTTTTTTTNSQRDQIYGYQSWGGSEGGKLEKGGQKVQLPVTRQLSTRDVLYNMMTIVNTAIGYTGKLRV